MMQSGASQKTIFLQRLPPLLRAFASPRHWMQLSDIDLSNLDILPEIVGSFFYQAHGMYVSYFFFRNVNKLNIL
jgi:hypothetical protein